jgi:hypothetical protein
MARNDPPRRRVFRRTVVFAVVIAASVGGLALERTATGATTGNPSHAKLTTRYHYNPPNHNYEPPKHGYYPPPYPKPPHDGTTTTSTSTTTTTTVPVTTTTMKYPKPPMHCDKILVWCFDKHHHKVLIVKFHCRPPSGGHKPGHW